LKREDLLRLPVTVLVDAIMEREEQIEQIDEFQLKLGVALGKLKKFHQKLQKKMPVEFAQVAQSMMTSIKNEEHSPSYSNPLKKRNRSELNTFSGSPYSWLFPTGQKRQRRVGGEHIVMIKELNPDDYKDVRNNNTYLWINGEHRMKDIVRVFKPIKSELAAQYDYDRTVELHGEADEKLKVKFARSDNGTVRIQQKPKEPATINLSGTIFLKSNFPIEKLELLDKDMKPIKNKVYQRLLHHEPLRQQHQHLDVAKYKRSSQLTKKPRLSSKSPSNTIPASIRKTEGHSLGIVDNSPMETETTSQESGKIEKHFPKKPHRKGFEKAIKEMKKIAVVRPSKKPEPVITHKFALIIGNGNYSMCSLGSNPVNDAQAMRNEFESEYGYTVFYHENLTSQGMKKALYEFGEALCQHKGNSLAVVFFAGHGIQTAIGDEVDDFLLGIDCNFAHERELIRKELCVKAIVDELDAAEVSMAILVLDCNRDSSGLPGSKVSKNRSLTRSGLEIPKEELQRCMIFYACQPGEVAGNGENQHGLFTESLMLALRSQRKNCRHSPRFIDLLNDAAKLMKDREQIPAFEIMPLPGTSTDICIDGTLYKDWYK